MIQSMTGFVAHTFPFPGGELTLELRTINHRYLDVHLRLPDLLRGLEMSLREKIQQKIKRGRVDLSLRYQLDAETKEEFSLNQNALEALRTQCKTVMEYFPQTECNLVDLMRWPGVMQKQDCDLSELPQAVEQALDVVLEQVLEQRQREGGKIAEFIEVRLQNILSEHANIQEIGLKNSGKMREKLRQRVADLKTEVNSERFEQELVFLLQKQDIAEEIQRLSAHIEETQKVIVSGGVVGRRLDFLMQELNREANTLASKSFDSVLTQSAVEIKVLIEQIREQVQNIE
jgi:uncharacterized protein (TIGR00255 family)